MESKQPPTPPQPKQEETIFTGAPISNEVCMVEDHQLGLAVKLGSNSLSAERLCGLAVGLVKSWVAENPNVIKKKKPNGGYIS